MVFWSESKRRRALECYRGILDAWSTPHVEHRVSTCYGETFALTAGDPSRPAVILLPGAMATSAMWLRTIDVLMDSHYVLAVDLIGDAGFSAPARPWLHSDAHARWLDDVLDHFALDTVALVGASFGGLIALDYAVRRPDRVTHLGLVAPGGIGRLRPGFFLRTAPLLYLGPWGHRKALDVDMGFAAADRDASTNQEYLQLFRLVQAGFVARMQPLPTATDADLSALAIPVLAVVGGRDAIFDSAETRQRLAKCVPQVRLIHLPDAGHGLRDMTPEIASFLGAV
jgi:pimeloyl-ACP methyl ester carboxylesterase